MFEFALIAQAANDAANQVAWFKQGWFVLLLVVAVIVISYYLSRSISRATRTEEQHGWRLWTIFSILAISALLVALLWPPRFGVDLRGGITIIGQLKEDPTGTRSTLPA